MLTMPLSAPVNVTLSFEAGAYADLPVYELDLRAAGRIQHLSRVEGTEGVMVTPVEQSA